MLSGP